MSGLKKRTLGGFLKKWELSGLNINAPFIQVDFKPKKIDKTAAWHLYVELLTRVITQPLIDDDGDEITALQSIYTLFPTTREILKANKGCTEFTKLAIVLLNREIRPFTSKWHRIAEAGDFGKSEERKAFREELKLLQQTLKKYSRALADLAGVEDLTNLEEELITE